MSLFDMVSNPEVLYFVSVIIIRRVGHNISISLLLPSQQCGARQRKTDCNTHH